jgi:SulP family sulfate permease
MTGIGIILIILQLGPFLGHATPPGGVLGTLSQLGELIATIQPAETALAAFTFGLILFFPTRLRRFIPPQLLALLIGTLVSVWFLADSEVRRIGEIPTGLPDLQMPVFTAGQWQLMVVDALVLAVLGSIDALLTSVIAENMTRKEHSANKELFGQGVGNLASGLFGGIPGAGATMGTVVNIQTGGRSALSGLTRALLLLVVVIWAADLTAQIPLAVLAGIALKVGVDIIDWAFLKRAHRVSMKAAAIMYGVIGLTVFVDLITAVAIGVFVANVLTIERMSRLQSASIKAIRHAHGLEDLNSDEQMLLERGNGRILVFALGGPLIFGLAKAISRQYAVLTDHQVLIVDFTDVPVLGVSSSMALENIILEDLEQGRPVYIVGAEGDVRNRLRKLGLLDAVTAERVVASRQEALELANADLDARQTADEATAPA